MKVQRGYPKLFQHLYTMKYYFYVLVFCITSSVFAQVKGKVVDENNQPIPYVNISVEQENIGTTSEEDGTFEIATSQDKTLIFSCLGFETQKAKVVNNLQLVLHTKTNPLQEVMVKNNAFKTVVLGDYKGLKCNTGFSNVGQERSHTWAKLIKLNPKNLNCNFIKSIQFETNSRVTNALLNLRFIEVDAEGNPIKDILNHNKIIAVKKGNNTNIVDLTTEQIEIPTQGILIGFQYLKIDQNKVTFHGKKEQWICYEPSISAFFSSNGGTFKIIDNNIEMEHPNVEIPIRIVLTD